jgi:hypothetical protein
MKIVSVGHWLAIARLCRLTKQSHGQCAGGQQSEPPRNNSKTDQGFHDDTSASSLCSTGRRYFRDLDFDIGSAIKSAIEQEDASDHEDRGDHQTRQKARKTTAITLSQDASPSAARS